MKRSHVFLAIGLVGVTVPVVAILGTRLGDSMDAVALATNADSSSGTTTTSAPRLIPPDGVLSPGSSFRLRGTGFRPSVNGIVSVAGRRASAFRTTTGGRFSLTLEVPTDVRGDLQVVAVAGDQRASVTIALTSAKSSVAALPPGAVVVMAVGDLTSSARDSEALAVRNVVRTQNPAKILMLGDYQYQYGSRSAIRNGADRIWGPKPAGLWKRIAPTAGPTHDLKGCGRSDYDRYWGRSGLKPYSFDLGSWHIISLPSAVFRYHCNPAAVTSWLRQDLAQHTNTCTLAFWHEPYWTRPTSSHGRTTEVRPWVTLLYRAGVDVVLSGHQHNYQRFKPQTPGGTLDVARGIRSFVVGTGGVGSYSFTGRARNLAASAAGTYGALRLVLADGSFSWRYMRAAGRRFADSGSASCH